MDSPYQVVTEGGHIFNMFDGQIVHDKTGWHWYRKSGIWYDGVFNVASDFEVNGATLFYVVEPTEFSPADAIRKSQPKCGLCAKMLYEETVRAPGFEKRQEARMVLQDEIDAEKARAKLAAKEAANEPKTMAK